jgi:signal transduction histidine kinase
VLDERAASFGVADIDALVRESGLEVQLRIECQPLPNGADATVYRIVKEALVNAGKHAPGAAVSIDIHDEAGMLRVSVVNAQSTEAPADLPGGHGLAGMRERVLLFDGGLTAGPRPDGGWAVVATLPVRALDAMPSPQVA